MDPGGEVDDFSDHPNHNYDPTPTPRLCANTTPESYSRLKIKEWSFAARDVRQLEAANNPKDHKTSRAGPIDRRPGTRRLFCAEVAEYVAHRRRRRRRRRRSERRLGCSRGGEGGTWKGKSQR